MRTTLALLHATPLPAVIAVVVLTAISMAIRPLRLDSTQLLFWMRDLAGVAGNFLVVAAVTRRAGLMREGGLGLRLLHFLGVWILTGTTVLTGLFLLVLPGVYLWSRWMIAIPLAVADDRSIFAAMRESWRQTQGIVAPISLAILLAASGFIAATLIDFLIGMAKVPMTSTVAALCAAFSYCSTVLLWYLSIALYDLLRAKSDGLEEVFA